MDSDEGSRKFAAALAGATKAEPHVDHPARQVAFGAYEIAVFFIAGPRDIAAPSLVVEGAAGRGKFTQGPLCDSLLLPSTATGRYRSRSRR
jgi:hypothetical protein